MLLSPSPSETEALGALLSRVSEAAPDMTSEGFRRWLTEVGHPALGTKTYKAAYAFNHRWVILIPFDLPEMYRNRPWELEGELPAVTQQARYYSKLPLEDRPHHAASFAVRPWCLLQERGGLDTVARRLQEMPPDDMEGRQTLLERAEANRLAVWRASVAAFGQGVSGVHWANQGIRWDGSVFIMDYTGLVTVPVHSSVRRQWVENRQQAKRAGLPTYTGESCACGNTERDVFWKACVRCYTPHPDGNGNPPLPVVTQS